MPLSLSVIVPIRNEARILPGFLASLARSLPSAPPRHGWRAPRGVRINAVLVDCGSTDGSQAICRTWSRRRRWRTITVAVARPSVGAAVRTGVQRGRSTAVLVLPADCRLTAGAVKECLRKLNAGAIWGGFEKTYRPTSPWLSVYQAALNLIRTRWLGHLVWTNGIFFRRDALARAGGIPVLGFLEDVALSDRLRTVARPSILRGPIQVSSRRYQQRGVLRQIILNGLILFAHRFLGLSPQALGRWYHRQ